MNLNSEALTRVILAIIGVISTVVTGFLIPYLKSKTTKEQRDDIEYWTTVAIQAIEVYYRNNGEGKNGPLKKEFVIKFMRSLGTKLSDDQLSALIDAVVDKVINDPAEKFFADGYRE